MFLITEVFTRQNGLLQKSSHSRWDWNTFLNHAYLQPENLSRSTLELPQASEEVKPSVQTPSQPKPQSPAKPVHYDPARPNNGWLQHIYVFFPHGQSITLYLRPSNKIDSLKRTLAGMTSTGAELLLLLDYEGNELQDDLSLAETIFWQKEIPMYLVRKDVFVCLLSFRILMFQDSSVKTVPPYKFADLPHPDLEVPKDADLPSTLSPSDRVRMAFLSYSSDKKEYLTNAYENIKTRNFHCSLCLRHHDFQGKVYKVSTSEGNSTHCLQILQNFMVGQNHKLQKEWPACETQINDLVKRTQELQVHRNTTLSKVRQDVPLATYC
jgi:hypothetical protein